ncbi:polar amino acid transport system substrate-binding protein [Rhodoligotrophos appendicifer]|uniref:transporter substrate-binding domain-containing protein n=1 Tax=Rhodoligotrophos appendicifer TaxID=987056 RepID=UPI0011865599|nr:transporter substrate-binding domain-containing protein [Rhodoligotrophos appendicifer]
MIKVFLRSALGSSRIAASATHATLLALSLSCGLSAASAQTATGGADPAVQAQVPEKYRSGITAVYDPQYPPSYYIDENNKMVGYVLDFQHAIATKLGIPVKEEQAKFSGIVAGILGGRYDFSAFHDTPERREKMDIADITRTGTSVMVRAGNPDGLDLYELCGHKIGATQGGAQYLELLPKLQAKCTEKGEPEIEVSVFAGPNEGSLAVKTGRIQGWLDGAPYIGYIIKNSNNEFEKTATSDVTGVSGFAFRKGDPMAPLFKQALQSMIDDGSYQKLMAEWKIPELALEKALINGQ